MKRYLFLDIDGVCNHDEWYNKHHIEGNFKCGDCDPETVALLNQLQDLNVEVVISSSWGTMADKMLNDCGLKLPIVGHTDQVSNYCDWVCRGNEIAKWLHEHHIYEHMEDFYTYVIFDDMKELLMEQEENFVWVNKKHGLKQEHIDKARKILTTGVWVQQE